MALEQVYSDYFRIPLPLPSHYFSARIHSSLTDAIKSQQMTVSLNNAYNIYIYIKQWLNRRTWRPCITNIEACPGPQSQAGSIHTTQAMYYFRLPLIVFLAFQDTVSQKTEKEIVGHYNMCNATVWRVRVSTTAMTMHQCVLCVLLSYTSLSTTYKYWVLHTVPFVANLFRQQ